MGDPQAPAWQGSLLAVLMLVSACLQTLYEQQHMYRLRVLQMRLRAAITGLVYRKVSLRARCVCLCSGKATSPSWDDLGGGREPADSHLGCTPCTLTSLVVV